MKMFRKSEGFTLVELMVVVLIIGILVAIAIPVFNAASDSAKLRACHSNQRTIEGAVQQYKAAAPGNDFSGAVTGAPLVGATAYLKEIPRCPNSTTANYSVSSTYTVNCPATTGTHTHY